LPQFCEVTDILVIMATCPLVYVQLYNTEGINEHIQSYQIVSTQRTKLFLLRELSNKVIYYPHVFFGDGHMYITMRSYVLNV
jgi:hypothetical protein